MKVKVMESNKKTGWSWLSMLQISFGQVDLLISLGQVDFNQILTSMLLWSVTKNITSADLECVGQGYNSFKISYFIYFIPILTKFHQNATSSQIRKPTVIGNMTVDKS